MGLFSYTTFVCLWFLWVISSICPIICIEACLKCLRNTKGTRLIAAFFTMGWLKLLLSVIWGYTEIVGTISLLAMILRIRNPPQVDKPVVSEDKTVPPVPYSILLPKPLPDSPIDLPHSVTKDVETVKPVGKKPKAKPTANAKGKKNARLISRMARNKPKPPVNPNPIVLSEDSDSEVERFLASEYPYSEGLCAEPSYDFVSNLPPCLQNDPNYPGIKLPCEAPGHSSKPSPALSQPTVPPCDQCSSWLERYYLDVPMLQSRIHSLEDQVARLTSQKAKLQATDKKQRTTGSILFKNVESATAVVNSKLA
jgi:hypothetical protein